MSQVLYFAAAAAEEAHNELPMSPESFGAVALIALLSLLGLTWSFRNTRHKHR